MYRLTPRMLQRLERDFGKYHELFSGGRCLGWELEELLVAAIQSDTRARHNVFWQEAGHDDLADIHVRTNGEVHSLQIKSGQIKGRKDKYLVLSGHRLGRFDGNLSSITRYLNDMSANVISVPYRQVDDDRGRQHIYRVCYVDIGYLTGLNANDWERRSRSSYTQTTNDGVKFSLRPSMSWQVWWRIPLDLIEMSHEMIIR